MTWRWWLAGCWLGGTALAVEWVQTPVVVLALGWLGLLGFAMSGER